MSFATKLCHVVYADGSAHDVMKHPATDKGKISLPGEPVCECVCTQLVCQYDAETQGCVCVAGSGGGALYTCACTRVLTPGCTAHLCSNTPPSAEASTN